MAGYASVLDGGSKSHGVECADATRARHFAATFGLGGVAAARRREAGVHLAQEGNDRENGETAADMGDRDAEHAGNMAGGYGTERRADAGVARGAGGGEFGAVLNGRKGTKKMKLYLYEVVNCVNNWVYIGLTDNFSRRKWEHLAALKQGKHLNKKLQKDFSTYGIAQFSFNLLEELEVETLWQAEIRELEEIKKRENTYNIRNNDRLLSEKQKQKAIFRREMRLRDDKDWLERQNNLPPEPEQLRLVDPIQDNIEAYLQKQNNKS